MRYKCFSCGAEFDDIEQLASHKRRHQVASGTGSPSVTCLGCGKIIPLDGSKVNYSGPLTCPHCQRTMKVVIEGGDIVVARLG